MPRTKISKAATDLNVAVPTIIEFLRKKGITVDDSPNARIDEDVYEILVKEYKPDRVLKSKSEQMSVDRQAAKAKTSPRAEEIKIEPAPTRGPKVIGKIDLATGKPAQEQQQKEQPAEEKAPAPVVKKEEPAKKPQQEAPKAPVAEPVAKKQEPKPAEPVKEAPAHKPAPAPKVEKPRHEAPKHEKHAPAPQAKETPKPQAPKAPAPKVEAPKAEKPAEPKKEAKPALHEIYFHCVPEAEPAARDSQYRFFPFRLYVCVFSCRQTGHFHLDPDQLP